MEPDFNPYQASNYGEQVVAEELVIASKGRRFATYLIDYACFVATSFLVGLLVFAIFRERSEAILSSVPEFVLGALIMLAYYCFFEGIWGRTPGKWLCGTRVLNMDGVAPSFGQIVKRSFCRFIPFEALSFFGERGWHDSISKTQVVMAR